MKPAGSICLGFGLRPGYGLAVDDWRVAETWRLVQGKLVHRFGGVALGRLDPLAADRRRIAGRSAAGPGRAALGPHPRPAPAGRAAGNGSTGRRFRLPAQRDGRDLAAAGVAGNAAGVAEDRVGRDPARLLAQAEDGERAAGDRLGRRPLGRADAALWSLEYGRARGDGRPLAEAADRFLRRRSGRGAGGDADRPQDRRSLSRSFAEAARRGGRLSHARRTPPAIS